MISSQCLPGNIKRPQGPPPPAPAPSRVSNGTPTDIYRLPSDTPSDIYRVSSDNPSDAYRVSNESLSSLASDTEATQMSNPVPPPRKVRENHTVYFLYSRFAKRKGHYESSFFRVKLFFRCSKKNLGSNSVTTSVKVPF